MWSYTFWNIFFYKLVLTFFSHFFFTLFFPYAFFLHGLFGNVFLILSSSLLATILIITKLQLFNTVVYVFFWKKLRFFSSFFYPLICVSKPYTFWKYGNLFFDRDSDNNDLCAYIYMCVYARDAIPLISFIMIFIYLIFSLFIFVCCIDISFWAIMVALLCTHVCVP